MSHPPWRGSARRRRSMPRTLDLSDQVRNELLEGGEVVRGGEVVDERQRGAHPTCQGLVALVAEQRVQPDDLAGALADPPERLLEHLGLAAVEAVAEDHHGGAAVDQACEVMGG